MKIQKTLLTCILSATLWTTSATALAGGVPTMDMGVVAQTAEQAKQHIETIHQWTQNLQHLKDQIKNQIDHINAIKNIKDLDDVIAVFDRLQSVPDEWADIYKTVENTDPSKKLASLKFDPDLAMKNAMKDLTWVENMQKEFDPNNKRGTRHRLEEATNLLKTANSELALQKATAMILAEQTKIQQAKLEYDIMKSKYEADERANELLEDKVSKCIYQNLHKGDIKKCKNL